MNNFKYRVLRIEPNITAVHKCAASVCMCSSHSFWTLNSLDVPAGVTQEESLRGAPLLVGEQQKWYQQILQEVQNFVPHDYIKSCTVYTVVQQYVCVCVCVCVFSPFILDIKFVGRTSRGHAGGRSHRISHPHSFCGACLNFSREKDSAIPFPRRP